MSFSVWFSPVETGLVWSLVYCLFGLKTCLRLTLWKEKKNKNISISALFAAFVFYDSVAMYVLQLNFFSFSKINIYILTLVIDELIKPAHGYISMKRVWKSQISWLLLIHDELTENQKKLVFHSILSDLEGAGTFKPPTKVTSRTLAQKQ